MDNSMNQEPPDMEDGEIQQQPRTQATLMGLPNETLLSIGTLLHSTDSLSAFSRVNHRLHMLTVGRLFDRDPEDMLRWCLGWDRNEPLLALKALGFMPAWEHEPVRFERFLRDAILMRRFAFFQVFIEGVDFETIDNAQIRSAAESDTLQWNLQSPLIYATVFGEVAAVNMLIKAGADIHRPHGSKTPLISSLTGDLTTRLQIMEILLQAGALINFLPSLPSPHGAAIHVAVETHQPHALELLIRYGANPNLVDHRGATPMSLAVQNMDGEAIDILVREGAHTDISHPVGYEQVDRLTVAAVLQSTALIHNYLCQGDKLDVTYDATLWTCLHAAAYKGNAKIIQALIDFGSSSASTPDVNGNTPLHILCSSTDPHPAAALVLLNAGANIDAQNNDGLTALHIAASNRTGLAAALYLLNAGANPSTVTNRGWTALHLACKMNDLSMIRILFTNEGTRRTAKFTTPQGWTCLHIVAFHRNSPSLHWFLQLLARDNSFIDQQDNAGRTALFYAALSGRLFPVDDLLRAGADAQLTDFINIPPKFAAAIHGDYAILDRLINTPGGNVIHFDNFGRAMNWWRYEEIGVGQDAAPASVRHARAPPEFPVKVYCDVCLKSLPALPTPLESCTEEDVEIYHLYKCRGCLDGECLLCQNCASRRACFDLSHKPSGNGSDGEFWQKAVWYSEPVTQVTPAQFSFDRGLRQSQRYLRTVGVSEVWHRDKVVLVSEAQQAPQEATEAN